MIKYEASSYGQAITQVVVDRETEKYVFIKWSGGFDRRLKQPVYGRSYFDTFRGAKSWLEKKANEDLKQAKQRKAELPERFKKLEEAEGRAITQAERNLETIEKLQEEK